MIDWLEIVVKKTIQLWPHFYCFLVDLPANSTWDLDPAKGDNMMEHYFNICTMAVSRQTLKTAPIQEGKMHFPIRRRTHNQLCKNKTLLQLSMSRYNTVERDGVKYDTANAATTEATDYRDRVKSQMQLTIAYFCCTVSFSIKKTSIYKCFANMCFLTWNGKRLMCNTGQQIKEGQWFKYEQRNYTCWYNGSHEIKIL